VRITATQNGDNNYNQADPKNRSFCINPQPPELSIVTEGGNTNITSSSEDGNLWFKNGEFQSNLEGRSIPLDGATEDYTITARVMIGQCISEESNSLTITGLEKYLKVFPNPTADELNVSFRNVYDERRVDLIDARGMIRYSSSSQSIDFRLDMTGLPSGIYLLLVREGNSSRVHRILKR
jgi:hypothetical protein